MGASPGARTELSTKLNISLLQVVFIVRDMLYQMYINFLLIMHYTAYTYKHIASQFVTVHQEER